MQKGQTLPTVITWLDDVLYPSRMYHEGSCRAGASLLAQLFGVNVYDALVAAYRVGQEEVAVQSVLSDCFDACDARLVRKVTSAMIAHAPKIAPYEDAIETFCILQALGVPLALLGEGAPLGQRLVVRQLQVDRLFRSSIFVDPKHGDRGLQDALMLLELGGSLSADQAVIVCADPTRTLSLANMGWKVYHVLRHDMRFTKVIENPNVMPMINLYELPEALGLVAWTDG